MAAFDALKSTVDELAAWYWSHGRLRRGRHGIERSDWLNRLYDVRRSAESLEQEQGGKKTAALWGPSQVGKSTLLAKYLDNGAGDDGSGSILQWDASAPIRFENSAANPGVTSINPYNFRSDASAFISRLSIRDSVANPTYPVEIRLAKRTEIAHALAIGYILDWKRDKARTLSDAEVKDIAESLSKKNDPRPEVAFEQVFEVASLVAQFSMSSIQDNPFAPLTQAGINAILNCTPDGSGLVNNGIYGRLLWGKDPLIDQLFHDLLEFREKVLAKGRGAIRCCYKTAALLIDMASYPNATGGLDIEGKAIEPKAELEEELRSIGYVINGDDILLSLGKGAPLFSSARDFALFQGLIWQITLPIRRDLAVSRGAPLQSFVQLLEKYDVLDFPGVSNIGTGSEQLSGTLLEKNGDHLLFTHLLKMGKTSAMIAATTKGQIIDCFCLLLRTMSPLSRPGTLADGIRNWKRSLGSNVQPELHILNTFFGGFVNDVVQNPTSDHFTQALSSIKSLGETIEGARFHPILFAKYEKLVDAGGKQLTRESAPAVINGTAERLASQPQFNSLFQIPADELADIIRQSGTERLLKTLAAGSGFSRHALFSNLAKELHAQVASLIEAVSPETSGDVDIKLLQTWSERIQASVQSNSYFDQTACKKTALAARRLLYFDPETLPPIPTNLRVKPEEAAPYIDSILAQWRERSIEADVLQAAQIKNPGEKNRLLFSFSQRVNPRDAARWLIQHFGKVTNDTLARKGRRYLAVHLTNLISPRSEFVPPPDPFVKMIAYAAAESDPLGAEANCCPEYQSIIVPLVALLTKVQRTTVTGGEPQPGDDELIQISHSFKEKSA